MASTQDLKRRVRSVQNTQKITKAFELVASARLRRAQARIETMRPYADKMLELMSGVARASVSKQRLPLLQRREPETTAILLMTGDRGLAGAFNSQVLRRAFALGRELEGEGQKVRWLVAGKKGRSTLRFRGYEVANDWPGVYGCAGDRAHAHRAVRRGRVRSRDPGLQPLRLAARAEGDRAGGAADPGAPARDR
jgi:F-type H+-transporting ATPase subunit gamma